MITSYHAKYFSYELTRKRRGGDVERISQSLFDASVDLNPHQIDAALFALQNPLTKGVLLADEVGIRGQGKVITNIREVCALTPVSIKLDTEMVCLFRVAAKI